LALLSGVSPLAAQTTAPPQIYSNEEQVYFAGEAKAPVPMRITLLIVPTRPEIDKIPYTLAFVDAFGSEVFRPLPFADVARQIGAMPIAERMNLTIDGQMLELRRARPVTCWVAVKKDAPKADGSPDWYFQQGVKLHDQGGRAMVGGGETGAQPLVIRMRNVIWPTKADGTPSTNKPSVVLYVHKPDKPDSAESYVWADPGAARIGINLRWMQASCGIDGMEQP
jgi:hypothetical protein